MKIVFSKFRNWRKLIRKCRCRSVWEIIKLISVKEFPLKNDKKSEINDILSRKRWVALILIEVLWVSDQ